MKSRSFDFLDFALFSLTGRWLSKEQLISREQRLM
jgi:hypothetical protein